MLTVVPDPPKVAAQRTDKGNPSRNAGIVAKKATRRLSVGSSTPIRRNLHPDLGGPNNEISSDRTTLRGPSEPEIERARPS